MKEATDKSSKITSERAQRTQEQTSVVIKRRPSKAGAFYHQAELVVFARLSDAHCTIAMLNALWSHSTISAVYAASFDPWTTSYTLRAWEASRHSRLNTITHSYSWITLWNGSNRCLRNYGTDDQRSAPVRGEWIEIFLQRSFRLRICTV